MTKNVLRWVVLAFLGLFLIALTVGVVMIFQIKPEQYRRVIESYLSKQTGYAVSMGNLFFSKEVSWGLEAKKIELRKSPEETPIFQGEHALLHLDFFSLWGGKIGVKTEIDGGTLDYVAEEGGSHLIIHNLQAEAETSIPSNSMKSSGVGRLTTPKGPEVAWRIEGNPKGRMKFEIRYEKETALLTGEVFPGVDPPRFQAEIKVHQLNIQEVMQLAGAKKGEPILSGTGDGFLQIQGSGKTDKEIQRSLVGQGRFEIANGTLLDFNIVQYLLKQITILPALGEVLQQIFPPEFQSALNSSTTSFELLEINFSLQGNQITIPSLLLKSAEYAIEAEGSFDLDHNVNFKARLILLENLSKYLIQRVRELELVANDQGRIVIPFLYRGVWPKARPMPDLGYLATKLFRKAGDLLEQGLELLEKFGGKQKK